ncbi:hypothetical protein YPPY29_1665, partial [Yersinia pestis PY-29]|jgi:hypothetical protein
MHQ